MCMVLYEILQLGKFFTVRETETTLGTDIAWPSRKAISLLIIYLVKFLTCVPYFYVKVEIFIV